jgi:transketolase
MPASTALQSNALTTEQIARLQERARFVRTETVRLIEIAKVGHYSSTFSCAEIFSVLYYDVMRLKRGEPKWPDRDRFLMGKGHAAVGLYPLLADWGFFPTEWLDSYTRLGSPLGDHPDMRKVPGADFSSGSIGHALSAGLGMALGGRLQRPRLRRLLPARRRRDAGGAGLGGGDGRGAPQGAQRSMAIVDRNGYQLDGKSDEVMGVEPLADKWRSFGWEVHEVDGHDAAALALLLRRIKADLSRSLPVCVIAHTLKGKGVKYMETEPGWHLGYLAPEDAARALEEIMGGNS